MVCCCIYLRDGIGGGSLIKAKHNVYDKRDNREWLRKIMGDDLCRTLPPNASLRQGFKASIDLLGCGSTRWMQRTEILGVTSFSSPGKVSP
jgi:hypothetical protein